MNMKLSIAILVLAGTCLALSAQTQPAPDVDKTQRAVEPSTMPATQPGRLLMVTKDDKTGFIDTSGKVVVPLKFSADPKAMDFVGDFSEGLAPIGLFTAKDQPRKYGYIDRTGEFVIPPRFEYAEAFSQSLAPVRLAGKFGCINAKGEVVIDLKYSGLWSFSEGLALFQVVTKSDQDKVEIELGFIDTKGDVVIKPRAFALSSYRFFNGMLSFREGEKFGFMDKTGKVVIKPIFTSVGDFYNGLAVAWAAPLRAGYIDKTGEWVMEPTYFMATNFSEGLAAMKLDRGPNIGYIDKTGKTVIAPQFFHAGAFHDGLAKVALLPEGSTYGDTGAVFSMKIVGKFKFGFIDKTGKVVIPYTWEEVEDFADGVARVQIDGKFGYIDRPGKYLWEPTR
jgi:hypothetical protein